MKTKKLLKKLQKAEDSLRKGLKAIRDIREQVEPAPPMSESSMYAEREFIKAAEANPFLIRRPVPTPDEFYFHTKKKEAEAAEKIRGMEGEVISVDELTPGFDEERMDVIGQNGNTAEHYCQHPSFYLYAGEEKQVCTVCGIVESTKAR